MRIFQAFIVIFASVVLFLLPLTLAMYDFQTDLRADSFTVPTAVGVTTGNVTLAQPIYDDDTTTIGVLSDLNTDAPLFNTYNTTTRYTDFTGLTANTTRTLTVSYDVDALEGQTAIVALSDRIAWIFLLMAIAFAPAGLAAIFTGKGR